MRRDGRNAAILISVAAIVPTFFVMGFYPPESRLNIFIGSIVLLVCLWKFLDEKPKT